MTSQLKRLQQDVDDLEHYMEKVRQRGKKDLIGKLTRKLHFLQKTIAGHNTQAMQ